MSQIGMQMPGSAGATRSSLNVYTALMFIAVVCLAGATAIAWRTASALSPETGAMAPLTLQNPGNISFAN